MARGPSAKALLLTILGEFVLPHGGSVWTSTVVDALGVLDVDDRNARQALGRLADQGMVRSQKAGRKARWHLTESGTQLLTAGSQRIYEFGRGEDRWDERWLVVLCQVPEEQRAKRHALRRQLEFAGFGFLTPSVAVSPHLDREGAANAILKDLGLLPGAVVLRAETGEMVTPEELLQRAWDLESLAAGYDDFIAGFTRRSPRSPRAQFGAVVALVHTWRRFPFSDPEIPRRLLPARWSGSQAKRLFDDLHTAWGHGAEAWYTETESSTTI